MLRIFAANCPGWCVLMPKVSVIVPAYNEEEQIVQFLQDTLSSLDALRFDYEVVVVDDGSTDRTRERALSATNNPHVKVVGYDDNVGKGFALKYGFKHTSGDIVIFIDSDRDILPKQIVRYVGEAERADILIASKWHPKSHTDTPLIRRFLSHGFHLMVVLLTGLRVSDTQSGMKAFRRAVLETVLPRLAMKSFAFDAELLTVANLKGFRIVEYPIDIKMAGLTKLGPLIKMLWSMFIEILGIAYRLRVLKSYNNEGISLD